MICHFSQIIICLVFSFLTLLSLAQNGRNSTDQCDQSCGKDSVPYPFGFSENCGIKLNCSGNSGNIKIGEFLVQNVTSDQILIGLPAKCDRPIEELSGLYSRNFAPTWRNELLLENCSSPLNDCAMPRRIVESKLGFKACDLGVTNVTNNGTICYSGGNDGGNHGVEFLDYETVRQKWNCSVLLSSIMVDSNETASKSTGGSSTVELEFQTVELGWWLEGKCECDRNANCTVVVNGGSQQGFRCKCKEGYAGDGFVQGKGCWKARGGRIKFGTLIGGILAGAFFVAALALICYCIKRSSKSLKSRLNAKRMMCEAGNSRVPFYPYKEIERATNGFSEKQRLGAGAYGTVYAGKLHNDELVAIKKIRYRDHNSAEQVMNEIKLLSSVSHPNLVRLLGFCIEKGEQILVYEHVPNGTLSQHLQRERGYVLPWTIRLTIAAETAHSIAHLHSGMNPPIYHRDIKSSNILLDHNFNSKVADFGLSRFGMMDDSHISTEPQGTPGYVDPQYHQNFHLSDKSDVYSFGVVLVEIISAMKVVDFSRPQGEINLAALANDRIGKGRVDEIIDPLIEPNRDAWTLTSVHRVAELAFRCLAFHRDTRPSMMEVADELENIKLSGWAPLEENICEGSLVSTSCSTSLYQGSEKSLNTITTKKAGLGSMGLVVQERGSEKLLNTITTKKAGLGSMGLVVQERARNGLPMMEESTGNSPVSVHDPWLSDQSSPSSNSLLGNSFH